MLRRRFKTSARFETMTRALLFLVLLCCLCQCRREPPPSEPQPGNSSSNNSNDSSNRSSGGPCRYSTYSGTAKVTGIEPEPGADPDSSSELVVHFDVARDDPRLAGLTPTFQHNPEYKVRVGKNELREKRIAKGAEYRVEVQELTSGTCVPYSFKIDW